MSLQLSKLPLIELQNLHLYDLLALVQYFQSPIFDVHPAVLLFDSQPQELTKGGFN